jgi:hypothetical protein
MIDLDQINADGVNKIIDEVIAFCVEGKFDQAVEGARDLAEIFKAAAPAGPERDAMRQSYLSMMGYIEAEAGRKTGDIEAIRRGFYFAQQRAQRDRITVVGNA